MSDLPREGIERFDSIEPFQPHPLCPSGFMQTVSVKWNRPDLDPENDLRCTAFDVEDDQTPPDVMSGFYLQPELDVEPERPLVLVLHGMGGHALSGYMRSIAERLLSAGYPVLLWNNRGAGGSARRCKRLHHPGYTDDLRRLIDWLTDHQPRWIRRGLYSVAFSLGANLLLKYLGETGSDSRIAAAVSVSAPLDMETTSQQLRTGINRVFDKYLLKKQRDELLRDNADIDDEERNVIRSVRSVWELDDQFTGPRLGYDGAKEFYRENSAIETLDGVGVPTLVIHADDDPVVDPDVLSDRQWADGGPLFPAMTPRGGHTGFYAADGSRWHKNTAVRFFDHILQSSH